MQIEATETSENFVKRKREHITLALDENNQSTNLNEFDKIQLEHDPLPDVDLDTINIETSLFGSEVRTPYYVCSMTAGHNEGEKINATLAHACQAKGWPMGVGSQRRQLKDDAAKQEWLNIRRETPDVKFFGNIGIAQLIITDPSEIQRLVDTLEAFAITIHLNAMQECIQPEGTTNFKGGLKAIEKLCKTINVPVIVKETGCGFSKSALQRLKNTGISAVDLSGTGGTHWGRIEMCRAEQDSLQALAGQTFKDWGISTVQSLENANATETDYSIWASGGVRSGLDAAKALSMGADLVGFAQPILKAALNGSDAVQNLMHLYEKELKIAMFCTGSASIKHLQEKQIWQRIK